MDCGPYHNSSHPRAFFLCTERITLVRARMEEAGKKHTHPPSPLFSDENTLMPCTQRRLSPHVSTLISHRAMTRPPHILFLISIGSADHLLILIVPLELKRIMLLYRGGAWWWKVGALYRCVVGELKGALLDEDIVYALVPLLSVSLYSPPSDREPPAPSPWWAAACEAPCRRLRRGRRAREPDAPRSASSGRSA